MTKHCYFNGKLTTLNKVKVHPYDIGLLRGYAVFDVMCTQNQKPFYLEAHWQRFKNSARELGIKMKMNNREYRKIVERLLKRNKYKKSIIRTVLTGGISNNGFTYQPGNETFYILVEKFISYPRDFYENGIGVITLEYDRFCPQAKITNYVGAIKNQKIREKNKAEEIIYIKNGKALEASTSNFFLVKNGKLITTKDGILIGITRNVVIKIAKQNKIKIEERNIKVKELFTADELFLSATNKDIMPVVKIDSKKIGNGKVGEMTKRIMQLFADFVKKY